MCPPWRSDLVDEVAFITFRFISSTSDGLALLRGIGIKTR
jgi:hypothetical protein